MVAPSRPQHGCPALLRLSSRPCAIGGGHTWPGPIKKGTRFLWTYGHTRIARTWRSRTWRSEEEPRWAKRKGQAWIHTHLSESMKATANGETPSASSKHSRTTESQIILAELKKLNPVSQSKINTKAWGRKHTRDSVKIREPCLHCPFLLYSCALPCQV